MDRQTMIAQKGGLGSSHQETRRAAGVVSDERAGLLEIACLLRQEGVGLSQALRAEAAGSTLLESLQALHRDPDTEAIILISREPAPGTAERTLAAVRESDKPTVVCFLGADQRLIWRAGAIPAARLDEGAWRAAAWVRGWDQALVSARLQDQDEQLAGLAEDLGDRIQRGHRRLQGFFTSSTFRKEACLMVAEVAGAAAKEARFDLGADLSWQIHGAREALVEPGVCVVLLDMVLSYGATPSSAGALADLLKGDGPRPLVIAHVCGGGDEPRYLLEREAELRDAGVILAASNALAARLAGMLVGQPDRKWPRRSS